jgi:hypothetical protein
VKPDDFYIFLRFSALTFPALRLPGALDILRGETRLPRAFMDTRHALSVDLFISAVAQFQHSPSSWPAEMFLAVGWTSMAQAALGFVLTIRAYDRRKGYISLLLATCLALLPFIFRE